jgi:2-isopropylmalate synthase
MAPRDKLLLALRLEELGVDTIETGFPASSPAEAEATQLISRSLTRSRFATFCRAVVADVEMSVRIGGTANHEVQILATSSDLHLERKRRISRRESVQEITDTTAYARRLGVESVSVALEDASRGTPDLLRAQVSAALDAGADCIVVPDTSGCLTPARYGELVAAVRDWVPAEVRLSTHCHDDFGMALANTVAGLQAGADEAQVTLGGIGERAGNAGLLWWTWYASVEPPTSSDLVRACSLGFKRSAVGGRPISGRSRHLERATFHLRCGAVRRRVGLFRRRPV